MNTNNMGDAAGDDTDRRGTRATGHPELVFSRAVLARIWNGQIQLWEKFQDANAASPGCRRG